MIISDSNKKFIFIHIPKTGGTTIKKTLRSYYSNFVLEKIPNNFRKNNNYIEKHSSAETIRAALNQNIWNSYFKFAFVRNPWDWLVSAYHFIKKDKNDPRNKLANKLDYEKFIDWLFKQPKQKYPLLFGQNHYVYCKKNKLVDFIGKFENFQQDFNLICKKLNIKKTVLQKYNSTNRKIYEYYYTKRLQEKVGNFFKHDITIFNYKFGE
jgi:hypothetical protein